MKRTEIKRRPLADTVVATLEPDSKEYREHDGNNVYLRVRPDGKRRQSQDAEGLENQVWFRRC